VIDVGILTRDLGHVRPSSVYNLAGRTGCNHVVFVFSFADYLWTLASEKNEASSDARMTPAWSPSV
jgi:hypothetical protein